MECLPPQIIIASMAIDLHLIYFFGITGSVRRPANVLNGRLVRGPGLPSSEIEAKGRGLRLTASSAK